MTSRLSKRLELDYSNVLTAVFELMLNSGFRANDLLPECARSLRRAETRVRSLSRNESGGLAIAALVLDAWHRDRRYLRADGTPKGVRLYGNAPSVEALIRLQSGRRNPSDVVRRLEAFRLVVPNGRGLYKPSSDVAVISGNSPVASQHAARALSTLLETVGQNVSGARRLAPLIERVAEVPDLPREQVKAFRKFTQLQGRMFLRTVNDWLESRRARRPSGQRSSRTVRAGIHTYAYVASKARNDMMYERR
jgi:hypothetical protein